MNKQVSHVSVNGNWIPLQNCKFMDIEEDFQGRDLITFEYQGEIHQSYSTFRYIS